MNNPYIKRCLPFVVLVLISLLFSACGTSTEETLKTMAKETRETCPQIIDEYTTMTNCEALANRTLKFTYKLKGSFAESQKEEMTNAMKAVLVDKLKQRREVEFYISNDVRFEHLFLDNQKHTVMHVVIETTDYR